MTWMHRANVALTLKGKPEHFRSRGQEECSGIIHVLLELVFKRHDKTAHNKCDFCSTGART